MQEIRTEHLTVGYEKKPLIGDVNLSVRPGEILTLIGPNGSGKSTILKTITKQLKKLDGTVFLGENSMDELKDSQISKRLSMVMTERLRTELMSGREVVASGRYPYTGRFGILSKEDWVKVDEAIALVHAKEVQDQDFMKISDGQRQRLMLARAICQDTKILILDEPTSYLDMGFKMDILTNIRMLARDKKMAVIMSLHELDLAQKVSDTIACVRGDRIDRVGTPEEIFAGTYVQELYGVSDRSFDPVTGQIFLCAGYENAEGFWEHSADSCQNKDFCSDDKILNPVSPQVFVIGGAGSGIPVYNRLWREAIPFAAGILQENDVEYNAAMALASEVVSEKAFFPIGMEKVQAAKQLIDHCKTCICTVKEFGPFNEANRELAEYARGMGKIHNM
ncbi:ABC transporter ATP-binding protein [Roseburia sp. OF03-24]|uniref:ABC transporter ATP-binding protein n=1 Tax=Roseburia sp. OF03-24 TaxID=2292367 RepID=UPI000E481363|nr:ABC transporter ATP-binding protein [Roseburia sp. OF03-24]RGX93661.1 ABC transporter ATP-binding protein [Roseburia sp. OF03-24]